MADSKVLIIEDNDVISRLWEVTLRTEGFEVLVAGTGTDGLRLAREAKPSVILLDLMMPDMDGFQIFSQLKEGETSSIPVIVLTNLTGSDEILEARKMGAAEFVVKSTILPEQLVSKIRTLVARG